jgi:hypothetical protein
MHVNYTRHLISDSLVSCRFEVRTYESMAIFIDQFNVISIIRVKVHLEVLGACLEFRWAYQDRFECIPLVADG